MVASIADVLDQVRGRPTTVTAYGPEPSASLRAFLARFDVELCHESLPIPRDGGYLTVRRGGEYRGSVPVSALADPLDPPLDPPPDASVRGSAYGDLASLLTDTAFSGMEKRPLLASSREIEDRAWRTGRGTLYVGFQSLSAFRDQVRVYRGLAGGTDLTAHVYGRPDWTPPPLPGVSVHTQPEAGARGELGAYWFVVFDGGGDDRRACAVVAEEEEQGTYRGAWTHDSGVVRSFAAYLEGAYGSKTHDG